MSVLYLHIGTAKTGTTSLQYFLAHNEAALASRNACYPQFAFRYPDVSANRNGHFLIHPFQTAGGKTDRTRPSADYRTGLDLIRELAGKYDTLILSDESIYYYSQYRPDFWSRLKEDLAQYGIDLKIIVYLRRQDLLLESLYAQRVKWNGMAKTFPEYVKSMESDDSLFELDYSVYLDHVAAFVGTENLIVRVFERGQFAGAENSLYSDFLSCLGMSVSEGFTIERDVRNPRLDGAYLELSRIVNYLPSDRPNHHLIGNTMRNLLDISHPGFDRDARYTYFSRDELADFLATFAHSNSEVARRYLHRPDGVLFYETPAEYPELSVSDRELLCCTIVTYAKALEEMQNRLKKTNDELETLKKYSLLYRIRKFLKKVP